MARTHLRLARTPSEEFEQLYRESYGMVYNWVRYRMNDDAETEDIVAEAYMKAARAFDRFDSSRSKFSTWVITIAGNCMKSHWRKAKQTVALDDIPEAAFAQKGEQGAVDDRMLATRLLEVLDDSERELVFLKYYEGLRNVDIATRLDMNASTVSTRLSVAMAKMRRAL